MRFEKWCLGTSLVTFGAGLLLSCLLPAFALVYLLALVLVTTGVILLKKH